MDHSGAAVAVVVGGLRDVALRVCDTDQATYAIIFKGSGQGDAAGSALVPDALDGLPAAVDQSRAAVALRVGHQCLQSVAHEGIIICGDGVVLERIPDYAVQLVVLSAPRGYIVDCQAEAVNTLAVNCRVVHPDSSTEQVIDHSAARHYNLIRMSNRNNINCSNSNKMMCRMLKKIVFIALSLIILYVGFLTSLNDSSKAIDKGSNFH